MIRQLFQRLCLACFPAHALDGGIENLRQSSKAFLSVAQSVSPSVVFSRLKVR